ncbi:hypothetical protein L1887_18060 [Cichorium endivia]|nr:hypothetical protein L1887_18060 [Cichorium endivia]
MIRNKFLILSSQCTMKLIQFGRGNRRFCDLRLESDSGDSISLYTFLFVLHTKNLLLRFPTIPPQGNYSGGGGGDSSMKESHGRSRGRGGGGQDKIDALGRLFAPENHGLVHKHRFPPRPRQVSHGDSLILDISDPSESVVVGQTLKRPLVINESDGEQIYGRKEDLSNKSDNDSSRPFISKPTADQRSILTLEVISGPSCGARYSIQSTNKSKLPSTLGRVSPSDVLVTDSEVSGKHAKINWDPSGHWK